MKDKHLNRVYLTSTILSVKTYSYVITPLICPLLRVLAQLCCNGSGSLYSERQAKLVKHLLKLTKKIYNYIMRTQLNIYICI